MSVVTSGCSASKGGRLSRSEAGTLAVLVVAAGLSRIPLLGAGYGVDFDAWRLAGAARTIAATHTYTASRLSGARRSQRSRVPWWTTRSTGATAILRLLAVVFFALSVRALGNRDRS